MKKTLQLKPIRSNEQIMKMLESRKLIHRLCPGCDVHNPPPGDIAFSELYVSDPRFGPHKIISVTINRFEFSAFGTHSDNEEFILIGEEKAKPLYLLIALMNKADLEEKISNNTLTSEDFILLECVYNDPKLSFFTMFKDTPHGEATISGNEIPPSFYVTESKDLDLILTDFKDYVISIV
jgi:hypothetical protein